MTIDSKVAQAVVEHMVNEFPEIMDRCPDHRPPESWKHALACELWKVMNDKQWALERAKGRA